MTTKAAQREAELRAQTELLGTIDSLSSGLRGLANTVEYENAEVFKRIETIEVHIANLHKVMKRIIETTDQRDAGDRWKRGSNGNGETPPHA